ncbi:hypothetical protein D3C84_867040 [compost metagenome]
MQAVGIEHSVKFLVRITVLMLNACSARRFNPMGWLEVWIKAAVNSLHSFCDRVHVNVEMESGRTSL